MNNTYLKNFVPYGLAAFLIGIVGGFTSVLGPAFVQDIGISYNNTTWTALAMAIPAAALAPVLGRLSDALGRKTALLFGLALYMLGNVMTAAASSMVSMLPARFVVGLGTAAVSPVIMAYIVTEFPRDKTASGFALYMLISSSAVIFGPTIGGFIIESMGWRAMMRICVLICAAVLAACAVLCRSDASEKRKLRDFDCFGSVFVLVFFGFMLCLPTFGQNFGIRSPYFAVLAMLTAISLGVLIFVESRAKNPILPAGFMKRRVFVFSVAALFLTQGLMQANMSNVIIFTNYTQPGNTIVSSIVISVMYLGMSLGSVIVGPLADKYEPRNVLTWSFACTGLGCAVMLAFSENTAVIIPMLALGILGFGLGGNAAIFMGIVLFGISQEEAGAGTGTYGLFRDLSAPFGVAVLVPMFTNRITMLAESGVTPSAAAVSAMKMLASAELVCVLIGIIIVRMLPKVHNNMKQSKPQNDNLKRGKEIIKTEIRRGENV